MSIRRTHLPLDNYAQVPNLWMRDARLSRRARGLLAELLTHRVGWETTIESLVAGGPEGRDAIRSTIAELVQFGYLRRARLRGAGGKLAGVDYELREPVTDAPTSGNPTQADPPLKKTIRKKTKNQEHQRRVKTADEVGGRATESQMVFIDDLLSMLSASGYERAEYDLDSVRTIEDADELIKALWVAIEAEGRENVIEAARRAQVPVSDRALTWMRNEWPA